MKVVNYKAFRIVKDINISKGDVLSSRLPHKISMEDLLEMQRIDHFSHLPSRKQAIFVFPSIEYLESWLAYLFKESGNYYLLELNLNGDIEWFNADLILPNMTEEDANRYWTGRIFDINLIDTDILPEGLFIGKATVENVEFREYKR